MSLLKQARDLVGSAVDLFQRKGPNTGHVFLEGRFIHVMLDLVEKCNLQCTHCAFVSWREDVLQGETMSDELLDKLGADLFPHSWRVSLSCFHEPLLAPKRLLRAIKSCHDAGVERIDFITNGLLFTEKTARQVLEAGVNRIYFSVDGASPETYNKVRLGGEFETFVEKVRLVGRVRREMGLTGADTELSFIACMMKSNIHEAPVFVDLCAELEVDTLELRYLMKSDNAAISEDELLCHIPDEADRWYDEAIERAKEKGVLFELLPARFREAREKAHLVTGPPPFLDCGFPKNTIVIGPNGDVYPCCMWHGDDQPATLDPSEPFDSVWNGKAIRTLRRQLATGKLEEEACRQCIVHYDMSDPRYWKSYHFRV